jgi:hypothetical protein
LSLERLRVHAERDLIPPGAGHAPFLEPLWGPSGDKYDDPRSPIAGRYRAWRAEGAVLLRAAPLDEADIAVLPAGWEHYARVAERRAAALAFAERVRAASRPLVVFYAADSTEPVPLPGAHVFRTSLLRSQRGEREHVLPAFASDLAAALGGEPPVRPWRPRPVVGFCGYAPDAGARGAARRLARRVLGRPPHPASIRTRACRLLKRSGEVDTRFVFRPAYWAGALTPEGGLDFAAMRRAWDEFVENVVESDYVLALRGGGNFSVRLYEALSCGRIPVFVDTDSLLPFEGSVDWRSLCVWLEEPELPQIGAGVAAFHASLGPDGFLRRQRDCRRVYVERLAPEAFFRTLVPVLGGLEP